MSWVDNETAVTPDPTLSQWLSALASGLSSGVLGSKVTADELFVRVRIADWHRAAELCKNQLGCDYFCFLSGIDWLPNPELSGEKVFGDLEGEGDETSESTEMTWGAAGGDSRFQVLARLYSTKDHIGITLKADLPDDTLRAPSWVDLYAGADWHEREAWEMYGFDFEGHPRLRHIYLPGEFEGYPLRKDFPLLAREVKPWPGLVDVEPIPGDDAAESPTESADS